MPRIDRDNGVARLDQVAGHHVAGPGFLGGEADHRDGFGRGQQLMYGREIIKEHAGISRCGFVALQICMIKPEKGIILFFPRQHS